MNATMCSVGRFLASPRGLVLILFLLAPTAFFALGGGKWLSLEAFAAHRDQLHGYAQSHFWLFFVGWGLLYAAVVAFSLPGGALLSLATGFLFGRWLGTVLIVVSASLGATAVFSAARYLFADAARQRLERNPTAVRLLSGFGRDAASYLLFLRLVPVFPFWLVNLAPAFAPVPASTYLWTTVVGILPGSFVFANLGQSLGDIRSLQGLISAEVLISLGLLGLLALLPVGLRRFGWSRTLIAQRQEDKR
ncbi:TVP38/TMEM64 family protein [Methylococcus sp. ANG]|uniref:TVP38/TMEM64 family protein n=1 Tax=Methylococcus sp. ANG TaxID=3231903 RepID=UPI00345AEF71